MLTPHIDPNITHAGESRGPSISRAYENMGNFCVYRYFEWLLRSALRRYGLSFRRVGSECAGFAERSVKWGHHHASCRQLQLGQTNLNHQGYHPARRRPRRNQYHIELHRRTGRGRLPVFPDQTTIIRDFSVGNNSAANCFFLRYRVRHSPISFYQSVV